MSVFLQTAFYMSIGCISYAGFGNSSPGNLVTGFGFYNPYWLVGAVNIFVYVSLHGFGFLLPNSSSSQQHARWKFCRKNPCFIILFAVSTRHAFVFVALLHKQ